MLPMTMNSLQYPSMMPPLTMDVLQYQSMMMMPMTMNVLQYPSMMAPPTMDLVQYPSMINPNPITMDFLQYPFMMIPMTMDVLQYPFMMNPTTMNFSQYPSTMLPITMDELAERFEKLQIREKPNLCNLPMEILEMVIQNTDIVSRIALRKVSRTIRELVDKQEPLCDLIVLKINSKYVLMNLEGTFVRYKETAEYNANDIKMKIIDNVLQDLLTFMSNPKSRLNHLKVKFTDIYSFRYFLDAWKKHFPLGICVQKITVILIFLLGAEEDEKDYNALHEWFKMDSAQDAFIEFVDGETQRGRGNQIHWFRNDNPSHGELGEWRE